jgi:hypothetical protein
VRGNFGNWGRWGVFNLFGYGLSIRVRNNSDYVTSFSRVFSDQISLKAPDQFPNLSAYTASDYTQNRLKSRHMPEIPTQRDSHFMCQSKLYC